jgi:hypothetical protein
MKRLVKLLFPKTYQAIYDDGYIQAYNVYNNHYDDYDEDYDYQQYDHEYYQRELEYAQYELEMDRLYEERCLHEEYHAELAAEYEKECIKTREFLAEMYNPKPVGVPVLNAGDKIHLHSKEGMYTVAEVYNDSFAYCTKYSELSYANYSDYKCHAGGRWNNKGV